MTYKGVAGHPLVTISWIVVVFLEFVENPFSVGVNLLRSHQQSQGMVSGSVLLSIEICFGNIRASLIYFVPCVSRTVWIFQYFVQVSSAMWFKQNSNWFDRKVHKHRCRLHGPTDLIKIFKIKFHLFLKLWSWRLVGGFFYLYLRIR